MQAPRSGSGIAIVFGVLSLLLGAGLIYLHNHATGEKHRSVSFITQYSNRWVESSLKLNEQKLVNLTLERDCANQSEELKGYSNQLTSISSNLESAQVESKGITENSSAQLRAQSVRIETLEQEREGMTRNLSTLTNSIALLEVQIAATEKKLATSNTERETLIVELGRLRLEKADLENRFHDLGLVREQVRKLRDELSLSHRLAWLREGLLGSQRHSSFAELASAATLKPDLDVQLHNEGHGLPVGATPINAMTAPARTQ